MKTKDAKEEEEVEEEEEEENGRRGRGIRKERDMWAGEGRCVFLVIHVNIVLRWPRLVIVKCVRIKMNRWSPKVVFVCNCRGLLDQRIDGRTGGRKFCQKLQEKTL